MERLSNIMRTAQRSPRSAADQRLPQNLSAQQGQRQPGQVRRPLPEQNARLPASNRSSELYHARSAPPSRLPESQVEDYEEPVSAPSRPLTRPAYNSQRAMREGQYARYVEQPPPGDYYEEDESSELVSAEDQEAYGDDIMGMRYGYWEDGQQGYAGTRDYQSEQEYRQPMPRPREPRANTQEISPVGQRLAQLHSKGGPLVTREFYRVTPEPSPRDMAAREPREARLPQSIAGVQLTPLQPGSRTPQRTTQPLKSQQVARLQAEMQQRPMRSVRPTLPELAPREEADYTITLNSATNVCSICKGAGFLRSNVPFGHPQFGKPVACQCKEQERKRKRRQQLLEISNLGTFANKRFDTFNPRVPGMQEAFQVAESFAQSPDGWLLMIGPNGCGKTHLAAAVANQCLEAGSVVLFATVPDLLDHLRGAFAPDAAEVYDQLFARMREAEVLVLDDLGTQQSSPWANEKLFQLLNYRYNSRFPTVITVNPKGLQATDERVRSRLSDIGLVITVNLDRARDYRPNNPHRE